MICMGVLCTLYGFDLCCVCRLEAAQHCPAGGTQFPGAWQRDQLAEMEYARLIQLPRRPGAAQCRVSNARILSQKLEMHCTPSFLLLLHAPDRSGITAYDRSAPGMRTAAVCVPSFIAPALWRSSFHMATHARPSTRNAHLMWLTMAWDFLARRWSSAVIAWAM